MNTPLLTVGTQVGYVRPSDGKIAKGKIVETFGGTLARVDFSAGTDKEPDGHHVALADYNEDKKTPNTFHLVEVTKLAATSA
jgi:ribosomal protein L35AE/L33A